MVREHLIGPGFSSLGPSPCDSLISTSSQSRRIGQAKGCREEGGEEGGLVLVSAICHSAHMNPYEDGSVQIYARYICWVRSQESGNTTTATRRKGHHQQCWAQCRGQVDGLGSGDTQESKYTLCQTTFSAYPAPSRNQCWMANLDDLDIHI